MLLPESDAEDAQLEVLETIRRHAGPGAPQAQRLVRISGEDPALDLSRLRDRARLLSLTHALVGRMPPEARTVRGRIGAWIIRKIRRALFWYTPQILEFHRNVDQFAEELLQFAEELLREQRLREQLQTRSLIGEMAQREEALRLEVSRLEQDVRGLLDDVRGLLNKEAAARREVAANASEQFEKLGDRIGDGERRILTMRRSQVSQEMRLAAVLEQNRQRPDGTGPGPVAATMPDDSREADATNLTIQDEFRSTREDMRERLRIYLPILKSHGIGSPDMPLLDVGCGNGGWLEVLQKEGVCARGVDSDRVMIEECRKRRVEAVEGDALAYLRSLDAESLGGVTGFYFIEHLPFLAVMDLLDETVRVLQSGGVAVFETPRPGNVVASIQQFHDVPAPRQPVPGPLMRWLAEERGLCRVQVLEMHPQPEAVQAAGAVSAATQHLSQVFYGPQDYAIIGWKA